MYLKFHDYNNMNDSTYDHNEQNIQQLIEHEFGATLTNKIMQ